MLIVESDEIQAEIYHLSLSEEFDVEITSDFDSAKSIISDNSFDIILCDWVIADRKATVLVTEEHKTNHLHTPIIVVVTEDSREPSMIEAYNGGVSYYITKPYKVIQFTETLLSLKSQLNTIRQMRADNQQTLQATKCALSQAAIYGLGMDILAQANHASDIREVARVTLSALKLHGVHAAIEFRDVNNPQHFDTDLSACDDTTVKVFSVLRKQGRIFRFGRRLMFNDEDVSLLIKHIANRDVDIYDAVLDMGAKLLPTLNERYRGLMQQQALLDTSKDVHNVLARMHDALLSVAREKHDIMKVMTSEISASFHRLDFNEEQEAFFINLIEREIEQRADNEQLIDLDALMSGVSERLQSRLAELSIREGGKKSSESKEEFKDLEFF